MAQIAEQVVRPDVVLLTWNTALMVAQIGICVTLWLLQRKQQRLNQDVELKLKLLISRARLERSAVRLARRAENATSATREHHSIH